MLFYMQMKNWFIILLVLTMTYMIHQKFNTYNRKANPMFASASMGRLFK